MKLLSSRRFRLSMFAMMYIVQGIGLAYFRNFQKPYLDQLGISPDVIGLLSVILQLPFILKIFIGMLSDSVNLRGYGHRIPYMALGLVLAAAAFFAAGYVHPANQTVLFAVLVTAGSFSVTLFDSTTDGLAIDITPTKDQGLVQGVMVGGRAGAFILLSLVFGYLVQNTGEYRTIFMIIGFAMLVPLLWVLRVKEPARDHASTFNWAAFKSMGKPVFLWFALYAVVYSIASFGVDGLVTYYMSDRFGASGSVIGQYGALRGLGAVIGAIAGGYLLSRTGRKNGALGAALLITLGTGAFALATGVTGIQWLGLVWGCVWAFQEAVFLAYAMDVTDGRIAASMFAIMMGISNLASAVGDGAATALSDNWGFPMVFGVLAVFNLFTIPVILKLSAVQNARQAQSTVEARS